MNTKTITPMKAWMASATVTEQETLAEAVGTSRGMLYQYASGERDCSAERAGKFEAATAVMHRASKGRLPKIVRTVLCAACRACQYAAKCLGERAVVSDFPIIDSSQLEMPL